MDKNENEEKAKIMNNLYSRQIGTYGKETMNNLMNLKVLILGMRGNGLEIAKNMVLTGVNLVTIYDPTPVSICDLCSNYYLEEKDINQRRDESVLKKLKELNPFTHVDILQYQEKKEKEESFEDFLSKLNYNVIVQTEIISEEKVIKLSDYCHKNKIHFIYGVTFGLNGSIFNDFGEKFTIYDSDGREPKKYHIKEITNEEKAIMVIEEKVSFKENDCIRLKTIEGMTELNKLKEPIKILEVKKDEKDNKKFVLDINTTNFSKYIAGGLAYKPKDPIEKNFKSYKECYSIPFNRKEKEEYFSIYEESEEFLYTEKYYLCIFLAIGKYLNQNENLPELNDLEKAKEIAKIAKDLFEQILNHDKEMNMEYDEYSEEEIRKFDEKEVINIIKVCKAEIAPMCSIIGGLTSQEIIKTTGKYEPIEQWKFYDFSFIKSNEKKEKIKEELKEEEKQEIKEEVKEEKVQIKEEVKEEIKEEVKEEKVQIKEEEKQEIKEEVKEEKDQMKEEAKEEIKEEAKEEKEQIKEEVKEEIKEEAKEEKVQIKEEVKEEKVQIKEEEKQEIKEEVKEEKDQIKEEEKQEIKEEAKEEKQEIKEEAKDEKDQIKEEVKEEIKEEAKEEKDQIKEEVKEEKDQMKEEEKQEIKEEVKEEKEEEICKTNLDSRYAEQIAIFGNNFQNKIENLELFIIGSGAIGCEVLKNFAMMGVSSKKEKQSLITDCDNIEMSNLNRQFLFRKEDIGKSKSLTACNAIKKMNPDFNCISSEERVEPKTENIFNEKFWKSKDFVICGLDNVKARNYVNKTCHKYNKTFLDAGTNGTKGRNTVVIPFVTAPMEFSQTNNQPSIPMCTLKFFPTRIEDCIEWSKVNFNSLFKMNILQFKNFIFESNEEIFKKLNEKAPADFVDIYKNIESFMKLMNQENEEKLIEKIIYKALEYFNEFYNIRIKELLKLNPPDKKIDGKPFWNAIKKAPKIIEEIDIKNKLTKLFIISFTHIFANCLLGKRNIDITDDKITKVLSEFNNNKNNGEKEEEKLDFDLEKDGEKFNTYKKEKFEEIKKFKDIINNNFNVYGKVKEEEFEKDGLDNYHMEFIQSSSNLRAQNYSIEPADYNKTLMVAGSIIQALPTTTTIVSGYLSLQLLALINSKNIEKEVQNANLDLSCNMFFNFSPSNYVPKPKIEPIKVNKSMTSQEFIDFCKNEHNFDVHSFDVDEKIFYTRRIFKDCEKTKDRYKKYIQKLNTKIEDCINNNLPEDKKKKEFIIKLYADRIINTTGSESIASEDTEDELPLVEYKPYAN